MSLLSIFRPMVEIFPMIASAYRGMRDQLEIMEKPIKTSWGFKLAGNNIMANGNFEPKETEIVLKLLAEVDVFVNVGANVGYYCCHAKSLGKYVVAFEPINRNLQLLCRNMKLNGWCDTEIYPLALTDQIGVVEMYGSDTGASIIKGWASSSEVHKTWVANSTLDKVLQNRFDGKKLLILVDIEGAEYQMLNGAIGFLKMKPKPIWVMEINLYDNQPDSIEVNPKFKDTFELFFGSGYRAFTADSNASPITIEDVELILSDKKYLESHNFIFLE